jgi:hypothetical protein
MCVIECTCGYETLMHGTLVEEYMEDEEVLAGLRCVKCGKPLLKDTHIANA